MFKFIIILILYNIQAFGNNLKKVRAKAFRMCEKRSWDLAATYSCYINLPDSDSYIRGTVLSSIIINKIIACFYIYNPRNIS